MKKRGWKLLLACCMMVLGVAGIAIPVQAAGDTSRYETVYMDKACPDIRVIAQAYLVGTDNVARSSSRVEIDKVAPGTAIQGKTVPEKYLPQDNIDNLKQIFSPIQGGINVGWIDGAFLEIEGAKLNVVAYDSSKVIFWSNGYRAFVNPVNCRQNDWQLSHPAGFYQVSRKYVWLDTGRKENLVPAGETIAKAAVGRVTASFIGISPIPGVADSGDVFRIALNKELNIVSTELIPSETPDKTKDTYYKISFNANTATRYMTRVSPGYYYVKSKYINLYKTGAVKPGATTSGKIFRLTPSQVLRVRQTPESGNNVIGYLQSGAKVEVFEKGPSWTTIYFNSQKAYVSSSYVSAGNTAAPVKDVRNLRIQSIKKNRYVVAWDAVSGCTDYRVAFVTSPVFGKKVLYRTYHHKTNSIIVSSSYFKNNRGLSVVVAANFGSTATKSADLGLSVPNTPRTFTSKELKAGKKSVTVSRYVRNETIVQYSTNKSFKRAKTIRIKPYQKNTVIKRLKARTTYYVRSCNVTTKKTAAGRMKIYGNYSAARKVRTK